MLEAFRIETRSMSESSLEVMPTQTDLRIYKKFLSVKLKTQSIYTTLRIRNFSDTQPNNANSAPLER